MSSALKVADHLLQYNLNITVADARFAKPIDTQLVEKLWNEHQKLIIIEEGSAGGFSLIVYISYHLRIFLISMIKKLNA